jgi:hypothetical protein
LRLIFETTIAMKSLNIIPTLVLAGLSFSAPLTASARDYHGSRSIVRFYSGRPFCAYPSRPYFSNRPSISFGFYSTPSYYYDSYYDPYPTYRYYRGIPSPTYSYRSYTSDYSDDLAVDVQRALARRGYYRGPIDGDIGPGTRAAIRSYQYEHGLEVTARIDTALLRSLRVG